MTMEEQILVEAEDGLEFCNHEFAHENIDDIRICLKSIIKIIKTHTPLK